MIHGMNETEENVFMMSQIDIFMATHPIVDEISDGDSISPSALRSAFCEYMYKLMREGLATEREWHAATKSDINFHKYICALGYTADEVGYKIFKMRPPKQEIYEPVF